jgi:glycine cleavage system H protein
MVPRTRRGLIGSAARANRAASTLNPSLTPLIRSTKVKVPKNLLYTEEHEWILVEEGKATIGITDHAQDQLGDVVYAELPEVGKEVKQNDVIATVESVKAASEIYAPISGTVTEVNESLGDAPDAINAEPYDGGWLCRMTVADESEIENLMQPEDYQNLLEEL